MKIIKNIIASIFILYGIAGILGVGFLYYTGAAHEIFSGISIYKVPANIVGGALAIYGGVLAIKNHNSAITYIGISVVTYIVSASYEIILEYGVGFYNHIMLAYFWASGVQLVLTLILFIGIREANKSLKNGTREELRAP